MGLFKSIRKIFSNNQNEKEEINNESITLESIKKETSDNSVERFNFEVKGTFTDERQATIKKVISKLKSENEDFGYRQYEGFTNTEIKELLGEKVYQYQYESLYLARLEDEPKNEYDENAIKINLVDDEGNKHFVGYVPKDLTLKIKELRNNHPYYIGTSLRGGKFKKQDWNNNGNEIIRTGEDDYKIEISVSFWEELPQFMKESLENINNVQ